MVRVKWTNGNVEFFDNNSQLFNEVQFRRQIGLCYFWDEYEEF